MTAYVIGSSGVTPNSSDFIRLDNATAPPSPKTQPAPQRITPRRRNMRLTVYDSGPVDAILVNAGATAPLAIWMDNLKPRGKPIVPLTSSQGPGKIGSGMLLRVKREKNGYKASFISPIAIYHCFGGRDDEANKRLITLMAQGKWKAVQSLRRDSHEITDSCCLNVDDNCLSATVLDIELSCPAYDKNPDGSILLANSKSNNFNGFHSGHPGGPTK